MNNEFGKFFEDRSVQSIPYGDNQLLYKARYDDETDVIYLVSNALAKNRPEIGAGVECVATYSYTRHMLLTATQYTHGLGLTERDVLDQVVPKLYAQIEQAMESEKVIMTLDHIDSGRVEFIKKRAYCDFITGGKQPSWQQDVYELCKENMRLADYVQALNHEEEFVLSYVRKFIKDNQQKFEEECLLHSLYRDELNRLERAGEPYRTLRKIYRDIGRDVKTVTIGIEKDGNHAEAKVDAQKFVDELMSAPKFRVYVCKELMNAWKYNEVLGRDFFTLDDIAWIKHGSRVLYQK